MLNVDVYNRRKQKMRNFVNNKDLWIFPPMFWVVLAIWAILICFDFILSYYTAKHSNYKSEITCNLQSNKHFMVNDCSSKDILYLQGIIKWILINLSTRISNRNVHQISNSLKYDRKVQTEIVKLNSFKLVPYINSIWANLGLFN